MQMTSIENQEARLRAVEDRLDILNLLAGSALSSDAASESYWEAMFADGAVMDRGGNRAEESREQIMDIVRSSSQAAAIESGMAHAMAMPHVHIDGDRAVATGYLQVLVLDPNSQEVRLPGKDVRKALTTYHLTVNRWELARTAAGWQVTRRVIRPIATEDANQMLRSGIEAGN
ncbi:nuclear transport factor 2 family protein [Massilia sp. LXY-6]|uniref:nuclear transport factor 2 family protein n=1 Tax=Massilia sp. LXY-6 TaxID=3379823 RepID=UPI003EE3134F